MKVHVQETIAATLQKLNYPFPLDLLQKPSPVMSGNPLPTQKWDLITQDQAEAAHTAEGERVRLARQEKERIQEEATEWA
jgi:hypothetical protein